jgi:C1A family cysteine protease
MVSYNKTLTTLHRNQDYKVTADSQDWRDFYFNFNKSPLKEQVDLKSWSSPIFEQGRLGSCSAEATVGAYELLLKKEAPERFEKLSPLFVYYNSRLIEGDTNTDAGAYIRNAVKSIDKFGVCKESLWPYYIDDFKLPPGIECYTDATARKIKNYYRLDGIRDILSALNSGYPIVFGMQVYRQFALIELHGENTVKLPSDSEEPVGAHAMCLVGYDLPKKLLLARNSFGPYWGQNGHCWIPFEFVAEHFLDQWIFDIDLK